MGATEQALAPLKQQISDILKEASQDLYEHDWHLLHEEGLTQAWVNASPSDRPQRADRCLAFLRRLRKRDAAQRGRLAEQARTAPAPEEDTGGDRIEGLHAARLGRAGVILASELAHSYRSTHLGDRTLTDTEATAVLESPLARLWGHSDFESAGIPLLDHRVPEILPERALSPVGRVQLRIWAGDQQKSLSFDGAQYFATSSSTVVEIPGPPPFLQPKHVPVLPGSVLDALGQVSKQLRHALFWAEAAGAWFILTGQAPPTPPWRTRLRRSADGRWADIAIEALAFVSTASVTRLHKKLRARLATRSRGPTRLPPRKRVLLCDFMATRGVQRVSPKLCREYNATVRQEDRYGNWRNAARDYRDEINSNRAGARRASNRREVGE